MGYRNLYKRSTIDEMTNKPTKKVGFVTTNQTKIMITEKFKTAAKEGKLIILDRDLISEMSTFVQISGKSGGTVKRQATADAHDDLVMAAALAEEMSTSRNWDSDEQTSREVSEYVIDPETGFIIG